ncbi:MAG: MOSC domain-containing protein [Candidatus Bathyarchaeia archaeon]
MEKGRVLSVNISESRGEKKRNVGSCRAVEGAGLEGDGHYGFMHRQISLLSLESIETMRKLGLDVGPGDFAENLTVEGLDLKKLKVGDMIRIGKNVLLRISQIGKECHERCAIYFQAGDCVMPREGIFAEVLVGGEIRAGDEVEILSDDSFMEN